MISLAVLRAFENGMLHKVGEAVFVCQLVAGAGLHHQNEVSNLALSLFMDNPDAVGKDGFGVFVFLHDSKIGLQRYDNKKTFLTLQQFLPASRHCEEVRRSNPDKGALLSGLLRSSQ